jgi:broad specificity phosphatase PhoE
MGSIVLARHAQGSFFSDDYDQLSSEGLRQADQLGEYWRAQSVCFTEVYLGPRQRHRQTAERALAVCQTGSTPKPKLIMLPQWDEHQIDQLILRHGRSLAEETPELNPLFDALDAANDQAEQARCFQRLFERVAGGWLSGRIVRADVESWEAFQGRVHEGLDLILTGREGESQHGRRIAIFSSVGPISVIFQRVTGCPMETAMATGWQLRNSSLTKILFSPSQMTLQQFNTLPHLPDLREWTYR